MRVDGKGCPLRFLLTPGQCGDQKGFALWVTALQVRSGQWARPRNRPRKSVADAACPAGSNRRLLRRRGIDFLISGAWNHRCRGPLDKPAYRQCNQVGRSFARIRQCRRMATCQEKLASHDLAIVTLAAVVIWLQELA